MPKKWGDINCGGNECGVLLFDNDLKFSIKRLLGLVHFRLKLLDIGCNLGVDEQIKTKNKLAQKQQQQQQHQKQQQPNPPSVGVIDPEKVAEGDSDVNTEDLEELFVSMLNRLLIVQCKDEFQFAVTLQVCAFCFCFLFL